MLKQILEEIKKNQALANMDPESAPRETAAVYRGKITRAKENLGNLFYKYKNELQKRVIFIMVNGKSSKKFAETMTKNYPGIDFRAEDFYTNIVDQVDTQNYMNKTLSNSLVDILNAVVDNRCLEIGVTGRPVLLYKEKYNTVLKSKEDLVKVFSRMVNEQVGGEFVGIDLLDQAATKAAREGFAGKVMPIVVHSQNNDLLNELKKDFHQRLTPNVFTVTAGIASKEVSSQSTITVTGKITKKSIEETIKKIKAELR